jgi:hypothetical protein
MATHEALRRQVCPGDGRVKFAVKVLHILQYTQQHPDSRDQLGAAWCRDGRHFIVNSKILGNFLNLKSNTINTNFRDHGFQIMSCNQTELAGEFRGLTDTRHWKKRIGPDFTRGTTIRDAEQIPCLQEPPEAPGDQDLAILPPTIQGLLCTDVRQVLDLQRLRLDLPDGEIRFPRLIAAAADFWTARVDRVVPTVPLSRLVAAFLAIAPMPDAEARQFAANLGVLLEQQNDLSQLDDTVLFSTFVRFFAQYCPVHDPVATLREITAVPENDLWTFGANYSTGSVSTARRSSRTGFPRRLSWDIQSVLPRAC